MGDVQHLEFLCAQLYTSSDPTVRAQARKACESLVDHEDCQHICQMLLQRNQSPYCQIVALSTLLNFVSNKFSIIPTKVRLDIRNNALSHLAQHMDMEGFVQKAFLNLVCKVTKSGWFDCCADSNEWPFRDIVDSTRRFLDSGQSRAILVGVKLLAQLVNEMGSTTESDTTRAVFTQRKLSASFRDSFLLPIFRISIGLIRDAAQNLESLDFHDAIQAGVVYHSLQLAYNCLSFDFAGTLEAAEDASADDASLDTRVYLSTVQLPTSWRSIFLNSEAMDCLFRLYSALVPEISAMSLACLSRIASIRRTLFSAVERMAFLRVLVEGSKKVMSEQSAGLNHVEPYHEFCRLLCRIKCNFQLKELSDLAVYPDFIQLVAEFTIHSLGIGYQDTNANSLHYLLAMWQRLVASMYVNSNDTCYLMELAPRVTSAYIESALNSVNKYSARCNLQVNRLLSDGLKPSERRKQLSDVNEEDFFLDDATTFTHQLSQFAIIGRCDYFKTAEIVVKQFEQATAHWYKLVEEVAARDTYSEELVRHIAAEENKLACLVYLIGALISGRTHFGIRENHCALDGRLVVDVLDLMRLLDSQAYRGGPNSFFARGKLGRFTGLPAAGNGDSAGPMPPLLANRLHRHTASSTRLEMAMMNFLVNFKRMYLGENVSRTTKVYRLMDEAIGLGSEQAVLNVLVEKVLVNLKYWGHNYVVLERSLNFFQDLASTHNSLRKIRNLPLIEFILNGHEPEHFPFLTLPEKQTKPGIPGFGVQDGQSPVVSPGPLDEQLVGLPFNPQSYRLRRQYFALLTRLLMVDLEEDEDKFLNFISPLTLVTNKLVTVFFDNEANGAHGLTQESARTMLIGLARDLAGVVSSLSSKNACQMFVHWFYPTGFRLFNRAIELLPFDPQVTVPVLKMLTEVVDNKNGRITFDLTVPAGYLLMSEVAKVMVTFRGAFFQQRREVPDCSKYAMHIKPLTCAMNLLSTCLRGRFVNFGVFSLFGDKKLEEAVATAVEILVSLNESELTEYPKLCKAYFNLLEHLTQDHMVYLASLEPSVLEGLLRSIFLGIVSLDSNVCGTSCVCADFILTYMFKLVHRERRSSAVTSTGFGLNPQLMVMQAAAVSAPGDDPRRLVSVPSSEPLTNGQPGVPGAALTANVRACGLSVWADRSAIATARILQLLNDPHSTLMGLIRRMLALLLSLVMYEECKTQWGFSRPLLILILMNEGYFRELTERMLSPFKPERRQALAGIFGKLMHEVDGSLLTKNRDKFTQNLYSFRYALNDFFRASGAEASGAENGHAGVGNGAAACGGPGGGGAAAPANDCMEIVSLNMVLAQAAGLAYSSAGVTLC